MSRELIMFLDHTAALSGGEIALHDLLLQLDKSRYEPLVVLLQEGPLAEKLRAAKIETVILSTDQSLVTASKESMHGGSARLRSLTAVGKSILQVRKLLRERRPSLLHTNSLKADILGGFAGRLAGVPVLWHVRDRIEPDYLPGIAVSLFRILGKVLPQAVAANSEATLQTLRLSAKKPAGVIYSGVTLARYLPRAPLSEVDGIQRIAILGRLTPWKGQHIFLKAAARIAKEIPNARFLLVGSALFGEESYEQELKDLAATLGIADRVEFTGFRSDVPTLLSQIDLLVHASTTGEPFGQVVVQGMAAGLPVIASRGGGVPEILIDGESGLLTPMGDEEALARAMHTLLTDPQRACRLGAAARKRAESHFSIEQTTLSAEKLFARTLKSTR